MSKKMMKRSLALGALMAFVITGSAWAADVSFDNVNGSDELVVAETTHKAAVVLDGTSNKTALVVNAKLDSGNSRLYGVVLGNDDNLTVDGITKIAVKGGNGVEVRGFRNIAKESTNRNSIILNGLEVSATGSDAEVYGFDNRYKSDVTVKGNAKITAEQTSGSWLYAMALTTAGDATVNFDGAETEIVAKSNNGGGAESVELNGTSSITFNSDITTIKAESNYSAIGIQGNKQGIVVFEKGVVNIDIDNTGIATCIDATGVIGTNLTVEDKVSKFIVTVDGSGRDTGDFDYGNGTSALFAHNCLMDIAAQNLNITVNASESTDIANRSDTHGIIADEGGTVQITSKNINVTVTDSIGEGYAVLAGWRESDDKHAKGGKGSIILGGADSDITVNVTGNDVTGLMSRGQSVAGAEGSSLEVNGNSLNVTATSTGAAAYGLYVSNGTEDSQYKSDLIINSATTNITATGGKTYNIAVANYGQGVTKINGDVTIKSDDVAIETRGNAKTLINTDENGNSLGNKVVITGNIAYNKQDNANDDEIIDAVVNISLDGEESEFNGAIIATEGNGTAVESLQSKVTNGTNLGLYNGATWNVTGDSFVNTVNGTDGNIVLATENAESDDKLDVAKVDIGTNNNTNLTVSGDKKLTKAIEEGKVSADKVLATLNESVENKDDDSKAIATVKTAEGNILGSYVLNNEGKAELQESSRSAAVSEAGMNLKAHWRAHMNDMNKRMGELRFANGEAGVWTRMVRGESEYEGAKMQYNQYQLGYDEKLSVDKRWTVGAAVTFSEGDSSYATGSSDDKSTAFAIYGTKLNNDGTFVDLIARYARLESDIEDRNYTNGEYDTNGMSVSAEFGKRIQQGNGLWIEPQVELTYGTVDSATVKFADGSIANYGDMDSFIGRIGFSLGKDIKQGNVYARASYMYDFDGETETTFTNGVRSGKPVEEDFGGGWWEVGVGANINLSKATYIYADIEKTFGGEVDTNWQWNLGVRYSF